MNGAAAAARPTAAPPAAPQQPAPPRPPEPARPQPAASHPANGDAAAAANAALQEAEHESSSTEPAPSNPAPAVVGDEKLQRAWKAVSKQVGGLLGNVAELALSVGAIDDRRVRVRFDNAVNRDTCDQPAHKQQLEDALESITGRRLHLEFEANAAPAAAPQQRMSRRQRQAEIAQRPFVQAALELFGGQPDKLRYIPPKGK